MEEFQSLSLDNLSPNPLRPRDTIPQKSLIELADSIRKYGVLTPILVGEVDGTYQIIAGERRWRAAKLAGLKEIPAIIKKVSPKEVLVLALVENVQRENLNLLEQAAGIKRLKEDFGLGLQQIGERIGVDVDEIGDWLELLDLTDKIKSAYLASKISNQEVLKLAKIENPVERNEELESLLVNSKS